MSHSYYNSLWQEAIEDLAEQIDVECPPVSTNGSGKKVTTRTIAWDDAFKHYACLYIRYIQIFRKLEECFDQIVHPQKRRDIKLALESVMARVCQVKEQLVRFGPQGIQSDFLNLEEVLLDLKLTPDAVEMPIPRYFADRDMDDEEMSARRATLSKCLDESGMSASTLFADSETTAPRMTRAQAIRIIQRNERGRQGMDRGRFVRDMKLNDMYKRNKNVGRDPSEAATKVQRVWRGFVSRMKTRRLMEKELVFIGMRPPSKRDVAAEPDDVLKQSQLRELRKSRQVENEHKFVEALLGLKDSVHDVEGAEIKDRLWEERYQWWIKQREVTGKYPTSLDGFYREKAGLPPKTTKKRVKKKTTEKKTARTANPRGEKKGKKKKVDDAAAELAARQVQIGPTEIVGHMAEVVAKYREVWSKLDESSNHDQVHDPELAKEKLRPLVEEEIRTAVDEALMDYLVKIKSLVTKSKKKKKKGGSKKKGSKKRVGSKKKGKKSTKGKKGKKKKKCCEGANLCTNMLLGDMISILVKLRVLHELPEKVPALSDFVGSTNYLGSAYQKAGIVADPSYQQVRQCVAEYGILPLGSPYVRKNSQLINALLLYGPQGCGKTLLTRAIAGHCRATWFDLSARILLDSHGTGSEISRIVHMVFHVAQQLQPAVIYIDQVDEIFLTSRRKSADTVRLKNAIMAHKSILSKDARVLVIGNARAPYDSKVNQKDLIKFFGYKNSGRMLFIPPPDYGSRWQLWRHFINRTGLDMVEIEAQPSFDLHSLVYISEGHTAGSIERAVQKALPPRRVRQLFESRSQVSTQSIINQLSHTPYTYKEEYEALKKFEDDVTGAGERRKLRAKAEKEAAAEREAARKGGSRRRY